jgi:hypothetical protein
MTDDKKQEYRLIVEEISPQYLFAVRKLTTNEKIAMTVIGRTNSEELPFHKKPTTNL